jgi:hypothetical protein
MRTVGNIFDQVLKLLTMKLFLNLIPALAYAMVTFFFNMAGWTSEVSKSQEKQQIVSQLFLYQEINSQNNFVWIPNIRQSIALNEVRNLYLKDSPERSTGHTNADWNTKSATMSFIR